MRYILDRVNQEDIFEKYAGINVVINKKVSSPFRVDNNPSCQFYYTRAGKLKLRDFKPNEFHGDCFDAAAEVLKKDTRIKKDMHYVMKHIAHTFKIHEYENNDMPAPVIQYDKKSKEYREKSAHIVQVKLRQWFKVDDSIWKPIGRDVTPEILQYFNIYPCENIWIDGQLRYTHNSRDPAYAYYYGKNKQGVDMIRVYFPLRKKGSLRFYTNNACVQGFSQLQPSEFGLITKSLKDVVTAFTFGITAIAPPGEGVPLQSDVVWTIKNYCNHVLSLYDYDNTGIAGAIQLRDSHGICPILFTGSLWNRGGGYLGCKDLSDFCSKYGPNATYDLIETYKERFYDDLAVFNHFVNPNNYYSRYGIPA